MRKKKITAAVLSLLIAGGTVSGNIYGTVINGAETPASVIPTTKPAGEYVHGDINLDGIIDISDLSDLALILVDKKIPDDDHYRYGDVDYDGEVAVTDLALLRQYLSKKITSLPEPKVVSYASYEERKEAREQFLTNSYPTLNPTPPSESLKKADESSDADGYMKFVSRSTPLVLLETEDQNGRLNTVYSPISYYTAMTMTAECTANSTRDEIVKALCADDIDDLRSENRTLYRTVYFDNEKTYCKSANSIWMNDTYIYENDTVSQIEEKYNAEIFKKNFYDSKTAGEISEWIYKHTDNKLRPDIVIEDPVYELLRIVNTIVYKNVWEDYFLDAEDEDFHKEDGTDKKCSFIESIHECRVGSGDGYTVCEKKMKNGFTMNFVLPDEGVNIKEIIADADDMSAIYGKNDNYRNADVDLYVPVFDIASKFDLLETSKALGIDKAFHNGGSDFTAIIDPEKNKAHFLNDLPGKISEITQEAVLSVDQKGSEAAAYTVVAVSAVPYSAPMEEEKEFITIKLNRPFFYYITNSSDIPIFSGIVGDPTEE